MNKELIKQSRKQIKNSFGEALAKKATDEFCVANVFKPMIASSDFGVESIGLSSAGGQQPGIIMEFKKTLVEKSSSAKEKLTGKKISKLLESADGENFKLTMHQMLRDAAVKKARENAFKAIQNYKAQIERNIERNFAHGSNSLQLQPYLTRFCWLNHTMQTIAGNELLAEMASDPDVTKFDMPRKLEREIMDTGKLIFAPQYRQKFSITGKDLIVAVIDTEVALNHKAFGNRVVHQKNYTKEPWGNPDGHGTAVAGIIGSEDENFMGIAPGATIYNYKVLATTFAINATDFEGALAITQAVEDGAVIANCSWGTGPAGDGTLREARACNQAWDLGLTIVKSAGNKGPGRGTLTMPADARGVIVVGATGKDGKKIESYSSRGPLASGEQRPHLVAPGGSFGNGIFSCVTGGGFGEIQPPGTSFAAPHVSGLLALLIEDDPSLSPDELRNLVVKLCTKLGEFTSNDQGAGIISLSSLLTS